MITPIRLLFLIDSRFNIQSFNKTFSQTTQREFGKTPVEGESIFSIVSKERFEEIKGAFEKVLHGYAHEFDLEFNPGEGRWYHCRFIPVSDKHNIVIGIMTAITNITERKESERQKEFDQNNLKALLNNTNDLIWSLDRDFKLITSNHAFDEMVKLLAGFTPTKGSDILVAGVNEGQLKRFRKNYERAFLGESFTEIEYSYFPDDYWYEISYYPIYKEGAVVGTACFSRNITEQKKQKIICACWSRSLPIRTMLY